MSIENEIAIAQHAQNNIVIAGDHNTVHQFVQYVRKELSRYPYKFLSTYDIADRDIFFGRNAVVEELAGTIPRHKVLLINGASGAGKSSMLNAGVIPRLTEQGYRFLTIRDYTDPLQQLRTEFVHQQWLAEAETGSLIQMLRILHQHSVTLLVFDQFEQFFLHVPYATRQIFLKEFKECLSDLSVVEMNVVFAIRRDFLGQMLAEFEQVMPTHFSQESKRLDLYPLSKTEAREAIMNPLKNLTVKIGYDQTFVDEVLLTRLLEQTSDQIGIEPPHLQIVCNQLYEAAYRRLSTEVDMVQINVSLYDELGGVEKILQTYLDEVVKEITADQPAKIAVVRSLLKAMIETSGTRRFIGIVDLQRALPDVREVDIDLFLGQLQDRRVLETQQREGEWQFSLSHEIMVAQVASWYDEREWERKRAEETLERGLKEWASSKTLLNEKQFSHIRQWLPQVDETAEKLLVESERAHKRQKRNRIAVTALVIMTIFSASVVSIGFGILSRIAEEKAIESENKALRGQSLFLADLARQETKNHNFTVATLLALEALPNEENPDKPFVYEVQSALHNIILNQQDNIALPVKTTGKISFNPNGNQLAIVNHKILNLWDISNNGVNQVLSGHSDEINSVAYSSDGKWLLTASSDKTARLWDSLNGRLLLTLTGHTDKVNYTTVSFDAKWIATASHDNTVRLWDVSDGHLLSVLDGHELAVVHAVFSPDAKLLMSVSSDQVILWNVKNGKQLYTLGNHEDYEFNYATFSPDGERIVTTSYDGKIRLWETQGRKLLRSFEDQGGANCANFSSDGKRLVSASNDGKVRLWDVKSGKLTSVLEGHEDEVYCAYFDSSNKKIATVSKEESVRLWNMDAENKPVLILSGHTSSVNHASFSHDGKLVATVSGIPNVIVPNRGVQDNTLRLWDAQNGKSIHILMGHQSGINHVDFNYNDSLLVTASGDSTAHLWRVKDGQLLFKLTGHTGGISHAIFSSDSKYVLTSSQDMTAKLWSADDGKLLYTFTGHESPIFQSDISADNVHVVTASADKTARLWKINDGKLLFILEGHQGVLNYVVFSPDGKKVVTASDDHTSRIWDVSTGKLFHILSGHSDSVNRALFSSDGKLIITSSDDKTARVWDSMTGQLLNTLIGHEDMVTYATFSPDDQQVVTVSDDRTARIWDVKSGKTLAVLSSHQDLVHHAAFNPQDSTKVLTTSEDQTARLWKIFSVQELTALTKKRVSRKLTQEERKQFFLEY